MFGYVRPHRGELLVREYQQYKAVYCQLCRQLGKDYGVLARLTLSYDCTFYAMLALGTQGDRVSRRRGRCVVNPLKACDFLEGEGESYHKAAALSVLLTRQKLKDDLEDEGFWKKLGCRLLLLLGADRQGKRPPGGTRLWQSWRRTPPPPSARRKSPRRGWTSAPSPPPGSSPGSFGSWGAATPARAWPWSASATFWAGGSI